MLYYNRLWIIKCEFTKEGKTIMEKLKKRISNLKVAGKLKLYRITVLVMTLFLMLVALTSTLVIRSNIEKITDRFIPKGKWIGGATASYVDFDSQDTWQ